MKKKLTTLLGLLVLIAGLQFIMAPNSSLIGQTYRILVKQGLRANLPTLATGEFGFSTDTKELHIGSAVGNLRVMGDYITPEMYGAKGDGVTDDKVALQSTLTAAAISGGVVLLSPKTYLLKSGVTYGSNISIIGSGENSVLEVWNGGSGFTVLSPTSAGVSDVLFSNFTIDASSNHFSATSNTQCVSVDKTSRVTIDGVTFTNIDTMAVWCDSPATNPTTDFVVRNCRVITSKSGGFSFFGTLTDFGIYNNYFSGCGDDAIAVQEGTANGQPRRGIIIGNRVINCNVRGGPGSNATPNGILVYGAENVTVSGNEISNVVSCGIRVQSSGSYRSKNISVTGNTVTNAGITADSLSGVPVHGIYVLSSDNVTISGNTVNHCLGQGILVQDSTNVPISGNSSSSNRGDGISVIDSIGIPINGNVTMDNGDYPNFEHPYDDSSPEPYGILINSSGTAGAHCEDIIISGNRSGDTRAVASKTQEYGLILVGSTGENIQVASNNLVGNKLESISSAGGITNDIFWQNMTSVHTEVKTQANVGDYNLYIDWHHNGMSAGDTIGVVLDDASIHKTTIAAVLDMDLLTMTDAIPAGRHADVDASVDSVSWKLYLPIHNTLKWWFDAPVNTTETYQIDGTVVVNQNVATTATPTFSGLNLIGGTGTTKLFSYQADALADDGTVTLPDATSGMVLVSCNGEAGMWLVQADGTVTKISGSTNTAAADTDANLCVYDSGTGATVKNRLGATGEIRIVYYYN